MLDALLGLLRRFFNRIDIGSVIEARRRLESKLGSLEQRRAKYTIMLFFREIDREAIKQLYNYMDFIVDAVVKEISKIMRPLPRQKVRSIAEKIAASLMEEMQLIDESLAGGETRSATEEIVETILSREHIQKELREKLRSFNDCLTSVSLLYDLLGEIERREPSLWRSLLRRLWVSLGMLLILVVAGYAIKAYVESIGHLPAIIPALWLVATILAAIYIGVMLGGQAYRYDKLRDAFKNSYTLVAELTHVDPEKEDEACRDIVEGVRRLWSSSI